MESIERIIPNPWMAPKSGFAFGNGNGKVVFGNGNGGFAIGNGKAKVVFGKCPKNIHDHDERRKNETK